ITYHPAMLAVVTAPDNKPVTIHRSYLTEDGRKAPVNEPRKLYSPVAKGCAIRLSPLTSTLGIAEGIETALSASFMFGVPTWAAICAGMLETFEPPSTVEQVVIFGDNDANFIGQRAAYALATRLSSRLAVQVRIPEKPDTDWNDVLLAGVIGRAA